MFVCVGGGGCILPSLCVVGCNESDAILRDAVYERLDWRWRRQGTVGELREGMWAALNRMWQAQNDGVWPENQDAMSCAHTCAYIILTQRCSEQTHTHCHGKVGTSMRGQFDLFPPKQINVYVALFLRRTHTHTHTHTHSPNQLGFLRQGRNKVIWACKWLSQPGSDSQDSCY